MTARTATPNRVLTQEEGEAIIKPHAERFLDCVERAWKDWKGEEYERVRHIHPARSRANIMHDRMIHLARQLFESQSDVRVFQSQGRTMVAIEDKCVIRLKKLDKNKHAHGIPTTQFALFEMQVNFDGIPAELTHLDIGYILNDLQTELSGVYVTCPNGRRRNHWSFDLRTLAKGGGGEVVGLGLSPSGQSSTEPRFKVKEDAKRKDQAGGEDAGKS